MFRSAARRSDESTRSEYSSPPIIILPERRSDQRIRTVYRVAKVACGCDLGLWRVRNISDRGLMLKAGTSVEVGDHLSVSLSDKVVKTGRVKWCEGGNCGIEFDVPIDCAETLKDLVAEQRECDYRPPRIAVDAHAIAYCESGMHPVRVHDLSQHGIGFAHHGGFSPGMEVKLALESGEERRGVVRWSDDVHAGLFLVEPFTCEELEDAGRFREQNRGT
jgi:hypothetical protein